jgi:hypothetical protein
MGSEIVPMSQVDTRQLGRDSLFLLANLRFDEGGEAYRIKVRNLSSGGMMAEGELRVTQGAAVQIELRNIGWIAGTVAWKADGRFGVAFAEEIDPKLARAPVVGNPEQAEAPRFTRPPLPQADNDLTNFRKI